MKSNFERAKAHMERAYKAVSSLKVSGDVVDTVYEIREELRQAYRMVCEGEKERLDDAARPDSSVSACGRATFPSQGKAPSQSPSAPALPKGEPSAPSAQTSSTTPSAMRRGATCGSPFPVATGKALEEDDSKKRCRGELCSPAEDDGRTQEVRDNAAAADEV